LVDGVGMEGQNMEISRLKRFKIRLGRAITIRSMLILLIILSIVVFYGSYYYAKKRISNDKFNKIMANQEEINKSSIQVREEVKVYEEIHKMANTKIEADKIVGEINITEERINSLIIEVSKSDFQDKEELLKCLYRWKNNDFSQAVNQHNYVWEKLGGEVGRAYELKAK